MLFWFLCKCTVFILYVYKRNLVSESSSYFIAVLQYNNSDLMKHLKYAITDIVSLYTFLYTVFMLKWPLNWTIANHY